jgi:2-phosphoglycerate kinase
MNRDKESLSHVVWIGGPADSGKTTLAKWIAEKKGCGYYSSDETGAKHLRKLARANQKRRKYIESIFAEQWTGYTAEEIAECSIGIAKDRFQYVVDDMRGLNKSKLIIAEGTGFTPEIIYPVMSSEYQGIWLMPKEEMMEKSFKKKAEYLRSEMGDQADETINLLLRANKYMAECIKFQAERYGCKVYEIDERRTIEENAEAVWAYLSQHVVGDNRKSA